MKTPAEQTSPRPWSYSPAAPADLYTIRPLRRYGKAYGVVNKLTHRLDALCFSLADANEMAEALSHNAKRKLQLSAGY